MKRMVRESIGYSIDSRIDGNWFVSGYNHSGIVADFRGSEFIP
jgi:hypothetical protein